jgi:hypothetical protein
MPEDNGSSLTDMAAEKPKELTREAARGRSARTGLLALGGVTVVVGVAAAIVIALALIIYYVA